MLMRANHARAPFATPAVGNAVEDVDESLATLLLALDEADTGRAEPEVPKLTRGRIYSAAAAVAVALLLPFLVSTSASSSGAAASAPLPPEGALVVPSPEAEVAPAAAAQDTSEPMFPSEEAISVGRWQVELDSVEWDQTARILDANISPPAIPDGYGWALVHMTVENVGIERAAPGGIEVILRAGGWEVSHRDQADGTVRIPDSFMAQDLEPGESLSGNLGFWLPIRVASSDPGCVLDVRVRDSPMADVAAQSIACND